MADFTSLVLQGNNGNTGTPNYVSLGTAGTEWRWSDSSAQTNVASASWPLMTRPASGTSLVPYAYAFTADATGEGIYSAATAIPATFINTDYLQARWNWDNTGTFASLPIMTAYGDSNHNTPAVRATPAGDILAGHATDTTGTAVRSYLKAALWGRVTSAGAPGAGPGAMPLVTDGTTGAVSSAADAAWSAYQGLMADLDWLVFRAIPAATVADTLHCLIALFTGVSMTPGTLIPKISLRYTYT